MSKLYNIHLVGGHGEEDGVISRRLDPDERWLAACKDFISEFKEVQTQQGEFISTKRMIELFKDPLWQNNKALNFVTRENVAQKKKVCDLLLQVDKDIYLQILIDKQPTATAEDIPVLLVDVYLGSFNVERDVGYLSLYIRRCESSHAVSVFSEALHKENQKKA